jgi:hypothetical protein
VKKGKKRHPLNSFKTFKEKNAKKIKKEKLEATLKNLDGQFSYQIMESTVEIM